MNLCCIVIMDHSSSQASDKLDWTNFSLLIDNTKTDANRWFVSPN